MNIPLRVLVVEDSESDVRLLLRHLDRGGFETRHQRVSTQEQMQTALSTEPWDIIICDYVMPQFDAPEALNILKESRLDIPFIVVSGNIGEEIAVTMMKAGAHDYLLKNNLTRLVPAVQRELREADLRRRHRASEEERIKIEQRYRMLFDNASDAICIHDIHGRIIEVNAVMCKRLGYKREELLSLSITEIDRGETADVIQNRMQQLHPGERLVFESIHSRRDGTIIPVEINARLIHYESSQAALCIVRDITDRKNAEARIQEQARLLDLASDAILVCGLDTRVTYWNESAAQLYGWSALEAAGRRVSDLFDPQEFMFKFLNELGRQKEWSGEMVQTTRQGGTITVFSRWTLVCDLLAQPSAILVINTDITERKAMEARFLQAQRVDSIGMLAGGIAHDLNNMLQPFVIALPMLQQEIRSPGILEMLKSMETGLRRGTEILRQILVFTRGAAEVHIPVSSQRIFNDISNLMRDTLPKSIAIETRLAEDTRLVAGDITRLEQVLMNLCINSRDAMPDGGRLIISARNAEIDVNTASTLPGLTAGPHVIWTVTDTGKGIEPEVLNHIFDPFFTTKSSGKGTGLGLFTAMGIIRNHRGALLVHSTPGKGTDVIIYLPGISGREEASATPDPQHPPVICGNGETILLVEDEESVMQVIERALTDAHYHIIKAANGQEATLLYRKHKDTIRMAIVDLMLPPQLSGLDFIRTIRKENMSIRILTISGLITEIPSKEAAELHINGFLRKPFTSESLLLAIHTLMLASPKTVMVVKESGETRQK